jgi:hypothetical protein
VKERSIRIARCTAGGRGTNTLTISNSPRFCAKTVSNRSRMLTVRVPNHTVNRTHAYSSGSSPQSCALPCVPESS